jgi:dethiobiotin synthetase
MTRGIFITGTSTAVGKTVVAAGLLRRLARQGVRAAGLKPVATGGLRLGPLGALRNADALELQAAASLRLSYDDVNPWCFEPAIAPHIAAREAGRPVRLREMVDWYQRVTTGADVALVEGAGGWRVPLHPEGFLSDLPEALHLDVILVVGLTLGCLNHARLTAEAITGSGRCRLAGWIANAIDPGFERRTENVATLAGLLGAPPLAEVGLLDGSARSDHGHVLVEFLPARELDTVLIAPPAG